MRIPVFASFLVAAIASATGSDDLPTLTSTIISSVCSSSSLGVYYGNTTTSEADSFIYETDFVTNQNTLTSLQTVCTDDDCYVTTVLNTYATVVTTVDGILTTYVTASPYTVIYNDETTSTVGGSSATSYAASAAAAAVSTAAQTSVSSSDTGSSAKTSYTSYVPNVETPSTSAETVTDAQTTVLTLTNCASAKCVATSVTTGVTVVTSTINGVKTVYTTFCPLSGKTESTGVAAQSTGPLSSVTSTPSIRSTSIVSEAIITTEHSGNGSPSFINEVRTTIVTVTSCNDHDCSAIPKTTGVAYFTSTVGNTETIFTTYCPLSGKTFSTAEPSNSTPSRATNLSISKVTSIPVSLENSAFSSSTIAAISPAASTVNVITNNIITQSKTAGQSALTSVEVATALVSSYSGGATRVLPAVFALPIMFVLF